MGMNSVLAPDGGRGDSNVFRRIAKQWRLLAEDRRGAVIIYVTLGLTVFLGFSALAIDGSYLFLMTNRAQSAADAAALAAASQLPDEAAASDAAIEFAGKNLASDRWGDVLTDSDIAFGNWNTDTRAFSEGGEPSNAVQVVVRMSDDNANPVQLFFANMMGYSEAGIAAAAIATTGGEGGGGPGEDCLLALNPSAADAISVVGTADIKGEGCNIQVDSCHEVNAFSANGTPTIDLTVELDGGGFGSGELNVCGGIAVTPNVNLPPAQYVNEDSGIQKGDPFAGTDYEDMPAAAETSSCDNNNFSATKNVTMWPGVYCGGISLTGDGTATLQPGTYYIKNGQFKVTGNRTLNGNGVTFVMTGGAANLDLGGVSSMSLAAPTTGDYAGFVFFGDADHPATATHKIHGTPLGAFHGIAYFPNATVEFKGTATGDVSGGTDDCSVMIADKFFFNGTVDIGLSSECSDYQGEEGPFQDLGPLALKLVD